MITIRLFRIGKKKQPAYKIVVTDKKNPPSGGRFIDQVGFYDPITKKRAINGEKVKYWIDKGASVSDTVHNFLVQEEIINDRKRKKHNIPEKEEKVSTKSTNIKEVLIEPDAKLATGEGPSSQEVSDVEMKEEQDV